MTEYVVINIENMDNDLNHSRAAIRQKFRQVQVEIARSTDYGRNDKTFIVSTHLGEILNFGDTVLGYDMELANISDLDDYKNFDVQLPDVILVKKTFPKLRKRQKKRYWKLKHYEDKAEVVEGDDEENDQDMDEEQEENANEKYKKKEKKTSKKA